MLIPYLGELGALIVGGCVMAVGITGAIAFLWWLNRPARPTAPPAPPVPSYTWRKVDDAWPKGDG